MKIETKYASPLVLENIYISEFEKSCFYFYIPARYDTDCFTSDEYCRHVTGQIVKTEKAADTEEPSGIDRFFRLSYRKGILPGKIPESIHEGYDIGEAEYQEVIRQ